MTMNAVLIILWLITSRVSCLPTNLMVVGMKSNSMFVWYWESNLTPYSYPSNTADGYMIILRDGRLAGFVSGDNVVKIINIFTGVVELTLSCTSYTLEELYNGLLATSGLDNNIKIWNILTTVVLVKEITMTSRQLYLKQLSMLNLLASGDANGAVYLFNTADFSLYKWFYAHNQGVVAIEELPNDYFATCSYDGYVKVWSITGLNFLSIADVFSNKLFAMKMISLDLLLFVGISNYIYLMNVKNGLLSLNRTIPLPNGATTAYDVKVTSTGQIFVTLNEGSIAFYNRTNLNLIQTRIINSATYVNYLAVINPYNFRDDDKKNDNVGVKFRSIADKIMPSAANNTIGSMTKNKKIKCLEWCKNLTECQAVTYDVQLNCTLFRINLAASATNQPGTNIFYKYN